MSGALQHMEGRFLSPPDHFEDRLFQVKTNSDPLPHVLLLVRMCMREEPEMAALFRTNKTEFIEACQKKYPKEEYSIPQAVAYLVDEEEQSQGLTLLISPSTGQAIAKLRPEDFYVPSKVPRADGSMVERSTQVRPEVQAFIFQHYYEEDRDAANEMEAREKVALSPPVAQDRMVQFVTRRGRKSVALQIYEGLPDIIQSALGVARTVFDYFPVSELEMRCDWTSVEWTAKILRGVADCKAQNMRFDMPANTQAAIATSWARSLGAWVMSQAEPFQDWSGPCGRKGLYLVGPSTERKLGLHHSDRLIVRDIEGLVVFIPEGVKGALFVEDYQMKWREVHDHWSVEATFFGKVAIDFTEIQTYRVPDVSIEAEVV